MTTNAATRTAEALAERIFTGCIQLAEMASIHIGYQLGLYETLVEHGPLTSAKLASAADVDERYAREWLEQQAVSGILGVENESATADARRYLLPDGAEQVLVERDSPGLTCERLSLPRFRSVAQFSVHLDEVRVPASHLVGAAGFGVLPVLDALNVERNLWAARKI